MAIKYESNVAILKAPATTQGARYQLLPELSQDDYKRLYDDIENHGCRVPIDVDEDGNILDGHHRLKICRDLGFEPDRRIVRDLSDAEKRDHARSVNVARRHLTKAQKADLILDILKENPHKSNSAVAREAGVTDKTASARRQEFERRSEIPSVSTITDGAGRTQPIRKPRNAAPSISEAKPANTTPQPVGQPVLVENRSPEPTPTPANDTPEIAPQPHDRRARVVKLIAENQAWTKKYGHARGDSSAREREWIGKELEALKALRTVYDACPWVKP